MTLVSQFRTLPETNQPKIQLLRHTRSCLVKFMMDNSHQLNIAVAQVTMYKTYPETYPETLADMRQLCRALVTVLAVACVPRQDIIKTENSCFYNEYKQFHGITLPCTNVP